MVFGKNYLDKGMYEKGFKAVVQELMNLAATPNISDYIPYIGALDLKGLSKHMKAISITFDEFLEKIIEEHVQSQNKDDDKTKDFVDVMLGFVGTKQSEYRIERSNIKAIMMDMLIGAMDTCATSIEWTIAELLKNPRVMKKVQKELEIVVGIKRNVEESDLDKLEYLNMVIKESLRIHPVVPLLVPHQSMEDCTVEDFFIPKNSGTDAMWGQWGQPNGVNRPHLPPLAYCICNLKFDIYAL